MNGRVYDYNVGRFMSVDPLIHGAGNSQGINPYSYILNNPLAGTDPSGYAPEKVEKTVRVSKTGSRIKQKVTVSAQSDGNGGATISISGGNGAARSAVKNSVAGSLSNAGYSVSDIGSQSEISKSDAAGLANASYGKSEPPKGWSAVTGDQLENDFGLTADDLNTEEGLNASLFYNENKDIYALAYAGTDPSSWGDIKADFLQNFGFESKQYTQALTLASTLSNRVDSSGLVFTGHSLGGGLASAASLKTGRRGYTFNAAGLHRNTMGGHINKARANNLITAYYAASDPLSYVQDNKWVGFALTAATRLPISFAPAAGRRKVVDGASGHSIQSMYDALR